MLDAALVGVTELNHLAAATQDAVEAVATTSAPATGSELPAPAWVTALLRDFGYAGIIIMLLLCGLGLPVPEEVTLIGSGYLSYLAKIHGETHPNWIIASFVCVFGILAGDSVVYGLGRRYGNALLKLPVIRHELTPARLAKFDHLFAKYGDRAIFFSRFVMGVRLASYFVAGRQRMPYFKFILLDLGGALLSGPTSVAFGYYFGSNISKAFQYAHEYSNILLLGLGVVIVGMIVYARVKARSARAA